MIVGNRLFEKIETILSGHYQFEKHEAILKYQIVLLKLLLILTSFLIAFMTVIRLYEGQMIQAGVDIVFIIILSVSFYFIHQNKHHYKIISRVVIGFGLFTVAVLMHTLPESLAPAIWITTVVYLMFFFLSREEAWRWLIIILSALILSYVLGYSLQHFVFSDIVILMGNIMLLSLVLTWYEKIKEDNEEQYIKNKIILEKKVEEKTKELSESNEALEELNRTLEQRVDSEIDKNVEKDKIMMAQSRQAAMGDMISMIAHQWRQPITAIGMGAQNMQLDIELEEVDPKRFDKKLNNIVEQTNFLSKTIDDFRDFLKPNKKPVACMLSEIVEGALNIIGKSLENNNITLEKSFKNDIEITTFRNEVIQVLINIINNAKDIIKMKEMGDGLITLEIDTDEDNAYIKICDNAGGIPEEVLPKIFEPYFSTKEESGGTGLGLYMSQMIVEKHLHGRIVAHNSAKGACFSVSLPLENDEGVLDD